MVYYFKHSAYHPYILQLISAGSQKSVGFAALQDLAQPKFDCVLANVQNYQSRDGSEGIVESIPVVGTEPSRREAPVLTPS